MWIRVPEAWQEIPATLLPAVLALLSLFAIPNFSNAQPNSLKQIVRHQWTSAQGLPQDSVLAMLQSHEGYLWLGTEAGLARFDGVRFLVLNQRNTPVLKSDWILSLVEDSTDTLWIGTSGGGLYRLKQGVIERWNDAEKKVGDTIYGLATSHDGSLWVGSERGLSCISGTSVRHFTQKDGVPEALTYSVIVADNDSRNNEEVWFATYGQGVGRWKNNHADIWTKKEGLSDNRVLLVAHPDAGSILVSCFGGHLMRFTGTRFEPYATRRNARTTGIWAISRWAPNGLALGSFGAGLGVVEQGSIKFLPSTTGVPANTVWSLLEDKEGNLWAGTTEGLFQFRQLPFTVFTRKDGLPGDNISSVWQGQTTPLLVGTNAGIVHFDPSRKPDQLHLLSSGHVVSVAEDDKRRLWFGTDGTGLWRRSNSSAPPTLIPGPWEPKPIYALAILEDEAAQGAQQLWVGSFGAGLFRCRDLNARYPFCTAVKEVPSLSVVTVIRGKNNVLWVGTRDGLHRYQKGAWRHFGSAQGLRSTNIASLLEDDGGTLWIGTEKGGVGRLRNESVEWSTTASGLWDDAVYSIVDDRQGRLWMGSPRGIFQVNKIDFPGSSSRPLIPIAYGLADGMLSTECSEDTPNAALRDSDRSLWFGTIKGLVHIQPDSVRNNLQRSNVLVEGIELDGSPVRGQPASIAISPYIRHIQLTYTGLNLTSPERQLFRYRMQGFDDRWIDAGTLRIASYTNLPPGGYQFLVQTRSPAGEWSVPGARISLLVRPHYYQTTWFLWAATVGTGLLLGSFYLARVQMLRRQFTLVLAERLRGMHSQEKANAEHVSELARMNTSLRDHLARLASGTDLGVSMKQVLTTAVQQLHAENACIFVHDAARGCVTRAFVAGLNIPTDESLQHIYFAGCPAVLPVERVPIWRHFQLNRDSLLLDTQSQESAALLWPEAIDWHKAKGLRMALSIPLFASDKLLGFMGINFKEKFEWKEFRAERWHLTASLGSLASMSLESHRLSLLARDAAVGEQRARLSEEMHDGIQQLFTAISFQLGGIQNRAKRAHSSSELLPYIEKTAAIAEHGLREVRRSIHALRDILPLSEVEFLELLDELCRSSESEEVSCTLYAKGPLHLGQSTRWNDLYRIAQEAISNVSKHADARTIQVRLTRSDNSLELAVVDDGCGFNVSDASNFSDGMRNLEARAKRAGGKLSVESVTGSTKVIVLIPNINADYLVVAG